MQKISIVVDVQGKIFKIFGDENFLSWKWPQANNNPNSKLDPRVSVRVKPWENDKR